MTDARTLLDIAVVGHTNAGKTSLLRTLARDSGFGEVSPSPATTREISAIALVAGGRGYSKLLMHLEKTLGVSVAFLADAVRKLGIDLAKAGTEENESDLMTKVLPAVKVALCNSRLGVLRDSTLDQILTASVRG